MNRKSEEINHIIDTVISCCETKVSDDGIQSFTRSDVLGSCRSVPVVMTRCIVVERLLGAGLSVATISEILHKSPPGIRNLLRRAQDYHRTSRAFRIAEEEVADILSK